MKKTYTLLLILLVFFSFNKKYDALTNISINNNKLIPEFNINTKIYNVYVNSKTEIITINVTPEEGEIITGNGSISLKKGLNEINIIAYKNEKETDKYKLNIFRGEYKNNKNDASLKDLKIQGYEIDFKTNDFSYFIDANRNETRVNISYETTNPRSTVKLFGDINLTKPKNIIKINVTSEDKKTTNTYKITVYKDIEKKTKKEKRKSIFDGKEFSPYELKIIIALIIMSGLTLIGILFYFIFIKKEKKTK